MKVLQFTVSHSGLELLMCAQAITRLLALEDLGRDRDQYVITALVREDMLDTIIKKSADRPRWVRWPGHS
jgi:hypothetical protein